MVMKISVIYSRNAFRLTFGKKGRYIFFMESESVDDIFDIHFEEEVVIRASDTREAG